MADNLSVNSEKDDTKKRALQQPQSQPKSKPPTNQKTPTQAKTTENQVELI
jgi:hypothetical protein